MNNMTETEKNRVLQTSLIDRQIYVGLGDVEEVSGAAYERVPVKFETPAGGQVQNAESIEFPIATGSWGDIRKIALYDQKTGERRCGRALRRSSRQSASPLNIKSLKATSS